MRVVQLPLIMSVTRTHDKWVALVDRKIAPLTEKENSTNNNCERFLLLKRYSSEARKRSRFIGSVGVFSGAEGCHKMKDTEELADIKLSMREGKCHVQQNGRRVKRLFGDILSNPPYPFNGREQKIFSAWRDSKIRMLNYKRVASNPYISSG
ncbi:hypothetical protein CEXT_60661 [Caerostris extrusa]|uniref:Uncharacterized protein n=1 Tax=Caerostris extrusa TaxID=172846 RepID=A0AAV4P065_CAEEX|nr:hypothetical protein CEXT_60661 [Caerostris extrusa]